MTLCAEGIEFSYNSHPVLEDIGFSLEKREILGLLGVNGAGKSTLLKCLNRILKPARGTVHVNGMDLTQMGGTEIARHMAYVPQKYGGEALNVFDAVLMGRKPRIRWTATEKDFRVVEAVLHQMGLEDFALRPVNDLSGGEMQKVVIARALAQEPEVLLLDEPTSSLDLKNQFEVLSLIRRIVRSRNLAAVISIHDLNLAFRFADRFLMIKGRKIFSVADRNDVTCEMIGEVYGIGVRLAAVDGHTVVVPV